MVLNKIQNRVVDYQIIPNKTHFSLPYHYDGIVEQNMNAIGIKEEGF